MSRYIKCCFCGCYLGEQNSFEEPPSSAYCVSCFAKYKGKSDDELPEQLQEWER